MFDDGLSYDDMCEALSSATDAIDRANELEARCARLVAEMRVVYAERDRLKAQVEELTAAHTYSTRGEQAGEGADAPKASSWDALEEFPGDIGDADESEPDNVGVVAASAFASASAPASAFAPAPASAPAAPAPAPAPAPAVGPVTTATDTKNIVAITPAPARARDAAASSTQAEATSVANVLSGAFQVCVWARLCFVCICFWFSPWFVVLCECLSPQF